MAILSITPSVSFLFSSCTFQTQSFFLHSHPSSNKTIARHPKNPSFRISASKDHSAAASRRDLLIGLSGLYGTTTSLGLDNNNNNNALGAPIQPPDLKKCGPPNLAPGATPVNCCPPVSSAIDFKFPPHHLPHRVRRPAHRVDADFVAKYNEAVKRMKDLPAEDPRSFAQQANVHCAYCDDAYEQFGFPKLKLQIHQCWLFFPWHRLYIYFHERILGKLIGDDTFALPFWNWDSPDGMKLPYIYTPTCSSLYDPFRNPANLPPTIIDLDYSNGFNAGQFIVENEPPEPYHHGFHQLIDNNLKIMYRQVVSNGATAELYFGKPFLAGASPSPGPGSLETVPHGTVHLWTGNPSESYLDMGNFYSSARDPVFYAHHSNIDRLWEVWRRLDWRRREFTSDDWLDAAFYFYDENAQLVRVKVRDCLSTERLRYRYEDVDNPWLNAKPRREGTGIPVKPEIEPIFPLSLDKTNVAATVKRPPKEGRKGDEVEVLEVNGIGYDSTVFVKFDVYVNASSDDVLKPAAAECAGSFVDLPHMKREGMSKMKTNLKLSITELLEEIGAKDDEEVVVTVVPRAGSEVTIDGLSIELLS